MICTSQYDKDNDDGNIIIIIIIIQIQLNSSFLKGWVKGQVAKNRNSTTYKHK